MTAILGAALAAALVALAGSLAEVRRLRGLLREERQMNDWQRQYLDRVGWRRGAGRGEPRGPATRTATEHTPEPA